MNPVAPPDLFDMLAAWLTFRDHIWREDYAPVNINQDKGKYDDKPEQVEMVDVKVRVTNPCFLVSIGVYSMIFGILYAVVVAVYSALRHEEEYKEEEEEEESLV